MKSKISKKPKRLGLNKIIGFLIIVLSLILTLVILLDGCGSSHTPEGTNQEIDWETGLEIEWDLADPLTNHENLDEEMEDSPVFEIIPFRGLDFIIPIDWQVQETENGLIIGIIHEGQRNLLLIERVHSSIDTPLERNLALVSSLLRETVENLEIEPILIAGLPSLRHEYQVTIDDIDYNIIGFLFPNGDELLYAQFATPADERVDEDLLAVVTLIILVLDLPPSQFPPL